MPAGFDAVSRVMVKTFYAARVKELVADFRANEKFYLSPAYQEQEARRDFIDKFWLALGWDVNHETQKNPFEQEVKVERKEHGFSQRRADYAFYLAPNFRDVKFYVEAKKPHGDIATADNYFQTIRYGWSSSTPVAVLHDFEQFEIVDCRYRPHIDTALAQNLRKYHFSHYEDPEKFAEIYWLFSREAVAGGSLEKFAETLPKKRGRGVQRGLFKGGDLPMGEQFLQDLDEFRDELARAFKNANPNLNGETLTELTQRTLDRLVFLRFLEDKHIEPQNHIAYFGDKGTAWQDFIAESRRLDGIYNGIVYKKHEILDAPGFKLDDDSFSGVCERLSHLNSSYDFNAIPIHILGSIYERFLGKVIVATDKRARLEEKPEVRKAGGVYYTPEYIVRYIVENTVGKLIAGKTPVQIAGMRFADIACGSGSFLLGVYDLLIRHHTAYYNQNPGKAKKGDVMERDDGLHLSLQKKREILLANIHGVDIDPQAVEVAQLSLYLKLLQDETPASARNYQMEFHETLLPTLNKNIVCGNSLIGTDILTGQLFASDEEKKLNPMDFEQRFPHIFKTGGGGALRETATPLDFTFPGVPLHGSYNYKKKKGPKVAPPAVPVFEGGFDAIVGNPPYIDVKELPDRIKTELSRKYRSATQRFDLYIPFIERGISCLAKDGLLGFIVPSMFMRREYGAALRSVILEKCSVSNVVDFGTNQIFSGPLNYVAIVVLQKGRSQKAIAVTKFSRTGLSASEISGVLGGNEESGVATFSVKPNALIANVEWQFLDERQSEFANRLFKDFHSLESIVGFASEGIHSGKDEVFFVPRETVKTLRLETPPVFPLAKGKDIHRYEAADSKSFPNCVVYPYDLSTGAVLTPKQLESDSPNTWKYLLRCKDVLKGRGYFEKSSKSWYELWCQRESALYVQQKIVGPEIANKGEFTLTKKHLFVNNKLKAIVLNKDIPEALEYVLGLLNSQLLTHLHRLIAPPKGNNYFEVKTRILGRLPIRRINFSEPADKARHDRMVALVEQMLAAKKQLAGVQSDKDKDFYTNRCDGLDRQIDALVYDLYALTSAEIKIVEGQA
jgi:type I restriction-modification system DNA methylase subunit